MPMQRAQQVQAQDQQGRGLQQQQQQQRQPQAKKLESGPGRITRVVGDLLIFAAAETKDGDVGLVFKPEKLVNYSGEPLVDFGVQVDTPIERIEWDADTWIVTSVEIFDQRSAPLSGAAAG